MTAKNRPWTLLARWYDRLVPGAVAMNTTARHRMLAGIGRIESALDLACGSGDTALSFARAGIESFGVDASPVFCARLRARARREKLRVTAIRGDMRTFRAPHRVDLVTCEFAALNNLANPADLPRVFAAVRRALVPGGFFLFDVNSLAAFAEQSNVTHFTDEPEFKVVMRGSFDARAARTRLDFDWFVPARRRATFEHVRETVFNVGWSTPRLRSALRAAGFKIVREADGMDVRPRGMCQKRGFDLYFLARSAGGPPR